MSPTEVFLLCLRDPQVGDLAFSDRPAWLWSADRSRLLWLNAAGAAQLGARTAAAALQAGLDRTHPAAREVARLVPGLSFAGAPQLSRLRGFSPRLAAGPLLCSCARVRLADGRGAIVIAGTQPAVPALPFEERVRRLFTGIGELAVFSREGALLYASPLAAAQIAGAAALDPARRQLGGSLKLETIGGGSATVLLARLDGLGSNGGDGWVAPVAEPPSASPVSPEAPSEFAALPLVPSGEPLRPVAFGPEPTEERRERTDAAARLREATENHTEEGAHDTADQPREAGHTADSAAAVTAEEAVEGPAVGPPEPSGEGAGEVERPPERRHPLRFVWQMDAAGRFTIQSDEFVDLAGHPTATLMGRPWNEIAAALALDPDGRVAQAVASRDTWSGLTVDWPAEGVEARLPVALSGLPVLGRDRAFCGYRGFGVCRAMDRIAEALLARDRRQSSSPAPAMEATALPSPEPPGERARPAPAELTPFATTAAPDAPTLPLQATAAGLRAQIRVLPAAPNVVPFPNGTVSERRPGALSAGERTAFQEIARALGARLEAPLGSEGAGRDGSGHKAADTGSDGPASRVALPSPEGVAPPPAVSTAGSDDPLAGNVPAAASPGKQPPAEAARAAEHPALSDESAAAQPEAKDGRSAGLSAAELQAILDTATDGVLVLDEAGEIRSANRGVEALFGYEAAELAGRSFTELFAPESERSALDYLYGLTQSGVASILNDGREVIGRVRQGGLVPLFMTMGRVGDAPGRLCAVFRDITQWKRAEEELTNAKREAERASLAKAEFLAKAGEELRAPLHAIMGLADSIRESRFGPLGHERYRQCAEDIHRSGAQVIALLDELLALSSVESGKLDLSFAKVDLNDVVHQCVATLQPKANRDRIIIRTSPSPSLPPVVADARSMRHIVLNLLSNSIKFTGPGGQVILSTALTERGEAVLRVRDTGIGMSEADVEAALEPFRQLTREGRNSEGSGLGLPLTKALAEANRASFSIKSNPGGGTLVEIVFPPTRVLAE